MDFKWSRMLLKRSENYWKSGWAGPDPGMPCSSGSSLLQHNPASADLLGWEGNWDSKGLPKSNSCHKQSSLLLHTAYQILFRFCWASFQLYLCLSSTLPSLLPTPLILLEMVSLIAFAHSSWHLATHWRCLMICVKLIVLKGWNITSIETAAVLNVVER